MIAALEEQVRRILGRARTTVSTAFRYLAEYGLRVFALTCFLAALILLVWAHWAVG